MPAFFRIMNTKHMNLNESRNVFKSVQFKRTAIKFVKGLYNRNSDYSVTIHPDQLNEDEEKEIGEEKIVWV